MRLESRLGYDANGVLITMRQWILDDYYTVWVPAESLGLGNTAARSEVGSIETVELANGADDGFTISMRPRTFWKNGNVRLTVSYTGDTSSTDTSSYDVIAFEYGSADATNTAPSAATETLAGPATAYYALEATLDSEVTLDYDTKLFGWEVDRKTSDTYSGAIEVFGVTLTYVPSE